MGAVDIQKVLSTFQVDEASPLCAQVQKALFLARALQQRAVSLETSSERRQRAEMARMLQRPEDKAILTRMTDEAFRSNNPRRVVEHLTHILRVQGIPRFFSAWEQFLLRGFRAFGEWLPGLALAAVKQHLRKETARVILPGQRQLLIHHLARRSREGVRMNVNFLGEAILSEAEAERRLQHYLATLEWPEIEVVSIKISTLYSQISPLAREHTVSVLCQRLERLILAAQRARFTRANGETGPKFVYLDMEEYQDKDLTAKAFMCTLDRPALKAVRAGIALQSYLPDSFQTLLTLQDWARRRVAAGGERITIRLVKGANLEAERVEASLRGWPQAPFQRKHETDANYKRMLHSALKPENLAAMDVGVASHNVFDLAYALALVHEANAWHAVQFEMLEGMANPQRRALQELAGNLLLYAPACKQEHFINAIGYLIRRLDENTGPENFLRHAFQLQVGSSEWKQQEQKFLDAFAAIPHLVEAPRRAQDRRRPPTQTSRRALAGGGWQHFLNEQDTDFALPQNGEWAKAILTKWEPLHDGKAPQIPLVIAGGEIFDGRGRLHCLDPSRPGVVVGCYPQSDETDIAAAVACAADDPDAWRLLPVRTRFEMLGRVADELRRARGDLLGAALANGGKTFLESDPEVSEAVDFCEFYRDTALWWQELPTLSAKPKGVVVVVSPWNFPIAIPCGGIAAALAAGNTVIFKPASATVLVAWELCRCFWRAGISQRVLQFAPCSGGAEARALVNHPRVNAVVLTGGTGTALAMLRANPRLTLFAETGGKGATIITALSDRDQAIKHVLHSAFSHAGQKCSATSLLLLEVEVYDDPGFRKALCEAAQSIRVGSAWNLETKMGPLIRPPSGDLENALKRLDPGEEWALRPESAGGNPNLWTPGIKYGVRPGSYSHLTEFFGPVLSVMRFTALPEAVALANQTGYGLTSGLESLDEREWDYWKNHIHAGNLYINRVTTGAIVLRQPFGGFGKSVFGPAMKAGSPNYVAQLMNFTDAPPDPGWKSSGSGRCQSALTPLAGALARRNHPEAQRIAAAAESFQRSYEEEFGRQHDHFSLVGQDNIRRYLPLRRVRVRLHPNDTVSDCFVRAMAACVLGGEVTISHPPSLASEGLNLLQELTSEDAGQIVFLEETDEQLIRAIREAQTDRVRYAAPDRVPLEVQKAANEAGGIIVSRTVSSEGRLELLWYLHEQSLSVDYHRYGNLGARAAEPRAPVL